MQKIVLITGGGRGIGRATALKAAAKGYAVVVNYARNKQAAEDVVHEILAAGGKAMAVQADVAKEEEVVAMFATVDETFGRVNALVNNAGILEKQSAVADMSAERWQRIFATNVIGTFLCAREAVKRMGKKYGGNGGVIVNVSSKAAAHGSPFEYVDYAATKGAVDTFTFGLSKEVAAEGIRANAVRPGVIYTEIHASGGEPGRPDRLGPSLPMQRSGTADEVADAILWLLGDESSYVTGALIDVTGGR